MLSESREEDIFPVSIWDDIFRFKILERLDGSLAPPDDQDIDVSEEIRDLLIDLKLIVIDAPDDPIEESQLIEESPSFLDNVRHDSGFLVFSWEIYGQSVYLGDSILEAHFLLLSLDNRSASSLQYLHSMERLNGIYMYCMFFLT